MLASRWCVRRESGRRMKAICQRQLAGFHKNLSSARSLSSLQQRGFCDPNVKRNKPLRRRLSSFRQAEDLEDMMSILSVIPTASSTSSQKQSSPKQNGMEKSPHHDSTLMQPARKIQQQKHHAKRRLPTQTEPSNSHHNQTSIKQNGAGKSSHSDRAKRKPDRKLNRKQKLSHEHAAKWLPTRQNPWSLVSRDVLEQETLRLQRIENNRGRKNTTTISARNSAQKDESPVRLEDYIDVLQAWIHQAEKEGIKAAQSAESLLVAMEQHLPVKPTLACHEIVLQAYAQCKNGGIPSAERAEKLFQHIIQNTSFTPTTNTLNFVAQAWANSGSQDAGERIASLRQATKSTTSPDVKTIEAEMNAFSKSGHPQAPERILDLLLETIDKWQKSQSLSEPPSDLSAVAPTIGMFHIAMGALSKSATKHNQRAIGQAAYQISSLMELILERQNEWDIKPTLRTYMIVLGALERVERVEKTGEAAQRAEALLDYLIRSAFHEAQQKHQQQKQDTGRRKDDISQQIPGPGAKINKSIVFPRNITFTSVMVALCHADQPDRAENLYHRLVNLYLTTKDPKLLPTTTSANAVLSGWGRRQRLDRVMELTHLMQRIAKETKHPDCLLNLQTFNILLNALGKMGRTDDCLTLLNWLESHKHKVAQPEDKFGDFFSAETISKDLQPDVVSYCSVLEVLGKQGYVEKAEATLAQMKRRQIKPTQISYTTLIHSYVPLKDPNKVEKAARLFQEVANTEKPDVACSVAFLQVCSHALPPERSMALDLAVQVYSALDPRERNHRTFKVFAKVIKNLVAWDTEEYEGGQPTKRWSTPVLAAEERSRMLQQVAKDCCEAGYLSSAVHNELEEALTSWSGSSALLADWSRNVKPHDRPRDLKHKQ